MAKISDEQKAFEKWYRNHHFAYASDLKQDRTEHEGVPGYKSEYIQACWTGWRARGASSASGDRNA